MSHHTIKKQHTPKEMSLIFFEKKYPIFFSKRIHLYTTSGGKKNTPIHRYCFRKDNTNILLVLSFGKVEKRKHLYTDYLFV